VNERVDRVVGLGVFVDEPLDAGCPCGPDTALQVDLAGSEFDAERVVAAVSGVGEVDDRDPLRVAVQQFHRVDPPVDCPPGVELQSDRRRETVDERRHLIDVGNVSEIVVIQQLEAVLVESVTDCGQPADHVFHRLQRTERGRIEVGHDEAATAELSIRLSDRLVLVLEFVEGDLRGGGLQTGTVERRRDVFEGSIVQPAELDTVEPLPADAFELGRHWLVQTPECR
jgi:hypothetical protein